MYDADVATTLMNRWEANSLDESGTAASLELLREGGLRFHLTKHDAQNSENRGSDGSAVECLWFDDGSAALRLVWLNPARDATCWAAVAPRKLSGQGLACQTKLNPAELAPQLFEQGN